MEIFFVTRFEDTANVGCFRYFSLTTFANECWRCGYNYLKTSLSKREIWCLIFKQVSFLDVVLFRQALSGGDCPATSHTLQRIGYRNCHQDLI